MNIQEYDVLNALFLNHYVNQRVLSEHCGHSLGAVNRSIKTLIAKGYLDENIQLTDTAKNEIICKAPKNAIILAAGFGMRMAPINMELPKAFLEVDSQPLIERIINQLHEVGIKDIYIVVGFMKEHFDYLIDKYGVNLIINTRYSQCNNLYSLKLVLDKLSNTYIIPSDVWCGTNPFRKHELYSWYMVSDLVDNESEVRVNRKKELVRIKEENGGNAMIGISYLLEEQSNQVRQAVNKLVESRRYEKAFWEEALYKNNKMILAARVVRSSDNVEINTYEQLREIDSNSKQLKSKAISIAAHTLNVNTENITDIAALKNGMTNRSFLFNCKGKKYIMRIPGEGTDKLVNRAQEAAVYQLINGKGICDNVIYINPQNGYKITEYIENAKVCDPFNKNDVIKCMNKLKRFHSMKLKVSHEFDLFSMIEFYESLRGTFSCYRDYEDTKKNVLSLKNFINKVQSDKVLSHIDAVCDNFLFTKDENGSEDIKLIDWEYAGMQDPHVDIAMFCIYAMYNREQIDELIHIYLREDFNEMLKLKIYCYISVCGLLWSNWCEYKRTLGVEFGEYALRQYRYAKDYYKIANEIMEEKGI